jgi:chemotaxis protein methyltransferase CheR
MKQNLKETGLAGVCEVITANMGLHFPVDRWNMLTRNLTLAAAEFGFQHFDDFTHWLLSARLEKEQIKILASYLTISETYFWREDPVFSALTDSILPELIDSKRNGEKNIRIWSAGCSTGEEAYSLAIALHRALSDINDWQVMIMGTDLNPKALNKAVSGIYSHWSFRNCPSWLKANYFHNLGDGKYEILPEIRKMVTFSNLNLTENIFPSLTNNTYAIDIIFCRNVLMYFTDDWISKISENLFQALNPNGWFVVSSVELSSQRFPQFRPVNFPGAVLYQKANKELTSSVNIPSFDFKSGIYMPIRVDLPVSAEIEITPSLPESVPEPYHLISNFTSTEKDHQVKLDSEPKVVTTTVEPNTAISLKIRFLANRGDLSEALLLCNEGIESDKLATGLYFLRSSILQELDKLGEATASIKQAIYLDPDFIMGHFVLGNISLQEGKLKQAKKYFNNALDLLNSCAADDILPESDGLSAKYMLEIILPNMQKLRYEE